MRCTFLKILLSVLLTSTLYQDESVTVLITSNAREVAAEKVILKE